VLLFLSARLADKPIYVEVAVARVTEDAAREVVGSGEGPFPRRRSEPGIIVNSIARSDARQKRYCESESVNPYIVAAVFLMSLSGMVEIPRLQAK